MANEESPFKELDTRVSRNRPARDGVDVTWWVVRGVLSAALLVLLGFLITKATVWLQPERPRPEPNEPAKVEWGK